jgi:hypothetical protein
MENRSEQYRRLARECLEIAFRLPDISPADPARVMLIEMARVWTRLAGQAPNPLVQQQEQVQPEKAE